MAKKPWILLFLPFGLSTCVVDALHAAETTHLPPHLSQWHKPRQLLLDASRRAHWLKFNCTIACLYTTHPPSHTHFSIKTLTLAFVFVRNKCRSDKPAPVFNTPFFLIISDRKGQKKKKEKWVVFWRDPHPNRKFMNTTVSPFLF